MAMLSAVRDKHIAIVTRYIITPSREVRARSRSRSPEVTRRQLNLAVASSKRKDENRTGQKGTGGTALMPFLKQARDETGEPAIDAWARRLLSNGPVDKSSASLSKVGEQPDGHLEVVGLCGTWTADDSEGGICHW